MPPRSDIEAIDQPTVLYILYGTISVQQTNLSPENASQNDAMFPKSRYGIYQTTSQCLNSYGCAIIVLYNILRILAALCDKKGVYYEYYNVIIYYGEPASWMCIDIECYCIIYIHIILIRSMQESTKHTTHSPYNIVQYYTVW